MKNLSSLLFQLCVLCTITSCNPTSSVEEPCGAYPFDFTLVDYEPDWSPDGSKIAYVYNDTTRRRYSIYLMNPDGIAKRQWHLGGSNLSWSPFLMVYLNGLWQQGLVNDEDYYSERKNLNKTQH